MPGSDPERMGQLEDDQDARKRILFVDAFDSFANNIISLLETSLDVIVEVVKIDASFPTGSLGPFLQQFDAVILGPGPGSPNHEQDVGLMRAILRVEERYVIPVLGVCLGFQVIAHEFGATIRELKAPCHGMIFDIFTNQSSVFEDIKGLSVTRYHSLEADIGHLREDVSQGFDVSLYSPTSACPSLLPLAWTTDCENGNVLMAVEHRTKPFLGLQYHPESICSNEESAKVIRNWWMKAQQWRNLKGNSAHVNRRTLPFKNCSSTAYDCCTPLCQLNGLNRTQHSEQSARKVQYSKRRTNAQQGKKLPTIDICEELGLQSGNLVLLDSQTLQNETGRFSIIGLTIPKETPTIEYYAAPKRLVYSTIGLGPRGIRSESRVEYEEDVWLRLSHFIDQRKVGDGAAKCPFWGGLMGFITYEAGLGTVKVHSAPLRASQNAVGGKPDISFAFVERSIVLDHLEHVYYVQSIRGADGDWVQKTAERVEACLHRLAQPSSHAPLDVGDIPSGQPLDACLTNYLKQAKSEFPSEGSYVAKVQDCKSEIRRGYSYELCLTDQTVVTIPHKEGYEWTLYRRLCERNPAPFAAYLRLGAATVLSSSPERFLHWDRGGKFQLRPIKGTVKKSSTINTLSAAAHYLRQPKELAENLMIVDLTRHDLYGILGSGHVSVPKLMQVEEYATVYQLVSVIEGEIHNSGKVHEDIGEKHEPVTGIDVLANCLPPGSMTGAPKKASCEILQRTEEHKPRGIYSGVLGYMCAGGGGSFSVVIRTAFKWADEGKGRPEDNQTKVNGDEDTQAKARSSDCATSRIATPAQSEACFDQDVWHIGAGGAITALSDPQSEWEEMKTKLSSVLTIFDTTFD